MMPIVRMRGELEKWSILGGVQLHCRLLAAAGCFSSCNRRLIHLQAGPFSFVRASRSRRTGLTSSPAMQARRIFKCTEPMSFYHRRALPLFLAYYSRKIFFPGLIVSLQSETGMDGYRHFTFHRSCATVFRLHLRRFQSKMVDG